MTSKRALLPLPQNPNVLETKCIKLNIPIDPPEYRQAFIGALINLTKWFSWERDETKMGAICASQFQDVLDSAITQLVTDSATNNCEDEMPNFRQVDCNLEALIGGVWTVIYTLQQGCINDIVNVGIRDNSITINYPPNNSQNITDAVEDATTSNDLDAVWGGCLELTEYVFETLNLILDLLEVTGDALETIANIFKGASDTVRETVKDKNGNDIQVESPRLLGDDGEFTTDIPVDKTEAIKGIDVGRLLDIFQSILDAGIALVRAGLTESYLETTAGKLFNILTCNPSDQRITTGIKLTTDDLYSWSQELLGGNIQDALVGVTIVADTVLESVDFLSMLDLGDAFRQYTLGLRAPNDTWISIVPACGGGVQRWTHTFDFTISSHAEYWTASSTIQAPFSIPEQTVWVSGEGWGKGRLFDNSRQRDWAYLQGVWDDCNIDTISVEFKAVAGVSGSFFANNVQWQATTDGTNYVSKWLVTPSTTIAGIFTKVTPPNQLAFNSIGALLQVSGYQRAGNNNPQGDTFIRKVTLSGFGISPFI